MASKASPRVLPICPIKPIFSQIDQRCHRVPNPVQEKATGWVVPLVRAVVRVGQGSVRDVVRATVFISH
jgi:hypothetical protein